MQKEEEEAARKEYEMDEFDTVGETGVEGAGPEGWEGEGEGEGGAGGEGGGGVCGEFCFLSAFLCSFS